MSNHLPDHASTPDDLPKLSSLFASGSDIDDDGREPRETTHYRSIFLSDVHLGAVGSKPAAVQDFLYSVDCDHLFLVGDIIDGWVTRERKWKQEHTNVIRTILGKAKHGTEIRYTPGNHDAFMRRMNGFEFGFIEFAHSFSHRTADGKDLLIVHGDLFDRSCTKYTKIAWLGAWLYEYAQAVNHRVNKKRKRKVDFASKLKRFTKSLFAPRDHFDEMLIEHAREEGYDGIVCGHVHRPEIRVLEDGFVYVNCGDWVEHKTAVVEYADGTLELIDWEKEKPTVEPTSSRSRRKRAKERAREIRRRNAATGAPR